MPPLPNDPLPPSVQRGRSFDGLGRDGMLPWPGRSCGVSRCSLFGTSAGSLFSRTSCTGPSAGSSIIQLGYNLPPSLLSKLNVSSLRIYVQAANVFTITKYIGLDPEIGGSATSFGVDKGIYPNDRQFLGGIQVSF